MQDIKDLRYVVEATEIDGSTKRISGSIENYADALLVASFTSELASVQQTTLFQFYHPHSTDKRPELIYRNGKQFWCACRGAAK